MESTTQNRIAVVTGCNRGLGKGIAEELLKQNYKVYGLNRTPSNLRWGLHYVDLQCDVRNYDEVEKAIESIDADEIDVLVPNAGVRRFSTIEEMSLTDWQDSLDINLSGVFNVTKACISRVKRAEGNVIIVGSHSEKYTFESGAAYCSTKGALKEFAECLMAETRYDNVRTTYLSLGSIKNRSHGGDEDWKMQPDEVGKAVVGILKLPRSIMVPYIDIRPSKPLRSDQSGIERLQYV